MKISAVNVFSVADGCEEHSVFGYEMKKYSIITSYTKGKQKRMSTQLLDMKSWVTPIFPENLSLFDSLPP